MLCSFVANPKMSFSFIPKSQHIANPTPNSYLLGSCCCSGDEIKLLVEATVKGELSLIPWAPSSPPNQDPFALNLMSTTHGNSKVSKIYEIGKRDLRELEICYPLCWSESLVQLCRSLRQRSISVSSCSLLFGHTASITTTTVGSVTRLAHGS